MWPFRKRVDTESSDDVRMLADKLEDVEDGLAHIQRRFTRLQQQVTRWAREYDEELDDTPEDAEDEVLREIVKRRQA